MGEYLKIRLKNSKENYGLIAICLHWIVALGFLRHLRRGLLSSFLYTLILEDWLQTDWKSFESVMDSIHKNGGKYVVWGLIAIHVGAALFHHFVRKTMF